MKRRIWQLVLAVMLTTSAVRSMFVLDDHGVPVSTLAYATFTMIVFGAEITRMAGAPRVRVFRCPDGCGVEFRATGQDAADVAAYQALALDHARHGQAAAR